jgi:predicted metal-dependent TIM-barrel fold hydrolase
MPCLVCTELERHIQTAREPVAAELLVGLTEAGKRNRAHQQEERIVKAQNDLARHQKSCVVIHGQPDAVSQNIG